LLSSAQTKQQRSEFKSTELGNPKNEPKKGLAMEIMEEY
jgi:hypothetical protein